MGQIAVNAGLVKTVHKILADLLQSQHLNPVVADSLDYLIGFGLSFVDVQRHDPGHIVLPVGMLKSCELISLAIEFVSFLVEGILPVDIQGQGGDKNQSREPS